MRTKVEIIIRPGAKHHSQTANQPGCFRAAGLMTRDRHLSEREMAKPAAAV